MLALLILFIAQAQTATDYNDPAQTHHAPKQYIFADRNNSDFSNRTSSAPFTVIEPHPLLLTNSTFENIFYSNTSIQARSQGSPTVSIRGSNQAARVLFVLDEIPLNFADGFGGSTLLVPLELTDTVQVVEGPTSALYGANALAGAIHFRTKKFQRPRIRANFTGKTLPWFSAARQTTASAVLPYNISDQHSVQASVFTERDDGDFEHTTEGRKEKRRNNSQSMARMTLGSRHDFGAWKLKTLGLYTSLDKTTPGPLRSPLVTHQESDIFFGAISANYQAQNIASNSVLSVSRFRSKYEDFGLNHSNSDKLFASEIFVYRLTPQLLSQTLIDFNWNRYQSSYTGAETFDRIEPEVAQTLIYQATSEWTIEPTVRYLTRYQRLLGQLHVPYRLQNSRVWLSLGQGFRPPALTDLYAQNAYFIGNRDLLPEQSFQSEIGLAWDFPLVTLSSSVFRTKYTNLFQSLSLQPGVSTKTNVGRARTLGMNMNARFDLHHAWQLQLSHTLMSARDLQSNTPLHFSPENQSFVSLTYARNSWNASLQHTLWSSFYDTDFNSAQVVRMAPWQGTDFLLFRKFENELSIGFGVFNMFNNPRQLTFDFPEPQRRFTMNVEIPF